MKVDKDFKKSYGRLCKDCFNSDCRLYRASRTPEQKEAFHEYFKQYYSEHKDIIQPRERVASRARKRRYYQENPQKFLQRNKAWKQANPEKERARAVRGQHRRRARIAAAEGAYSSKDWEQIIARQQGRCLACGHVPEKLTVDHIVPLSKGGTNWPSNLQGLCLSCNSKKGARLDRSTNEKHILDKDLYGVSC